jgi:hypothetical protein
MQKDKYVRNKKVEEEEMLSNGVPRNLQANLAKEI